MNAPPPVFPPPLLKHIAAWERCLHEDNDKDFILHGIRHGFSLIDSDVDIDDIAPAQVTNNLSTRSPLIQPIISEAINDELLSGGYVKCSDEPKIISALSAIPKPDGGIRLIHDLSRPNNQSVNSYATKDYCKYETINDALSLIQPGWFMAVVDLKSAYRSVHIRPAEHAITGLKWRFTNQSEPLIMCDTRLPFGARKSPAIFNRITQAVARSLRRDGHHVVVYLDDFFVCGPDFDSCKATFDVLITLLRGLGFQISWKKIVDPCQRLAFLGVQIDTVTGLLSLKPEKVQEVLNLLDIYQQRKRASRNQLESLAGKLCWASHVVPWGRAHIRSIFSLMSSLKSPTHKCRLGDLQPDLHWWRYWLDSGLNWRHIWPPSEQLNEYTDACSEAGGAFCNGNWFYVHWPSDVPRLTVHHINTKELAAVVMAAQVWRQNWANHHVVIHTDNQVTAAVINNGTARNSTCLDLLKHLASLALEFNFTISASYIPGIDNVMADTISRLHEPGKTDLLVNLFNAPLPCVLAHGGMSLKSWHVLFESSASGIN